MSTFLEFVASKKYELLGNAAVAAIGFLAALLVSSVVDGWKERRSAAALLITVQAEARSNEKALRESFQPFYAEGLVLREFATLAVSYALTNGTFVKHSSAASLEALGAYLRDISLANAYRSKAEAIRFSNSRSIKDWEGGLVEMWRINLGECQKTIPAVQSIE